MLADTERFLRDNVQQQVERGLARLGIHLILEDAGKTPVFRGIGGHLYLAGDAVRYLADQLDQFRIGVLVALVLGDELG